MARVANINCIEGVFALDRLVSLPNRQRASNTGRDSEVQVESGLSASQMMTMSLPYRAKG